MSSENESIAVGTARKKHVPVTSWTEREEFLLLLQVMKQVQIKDGKESNIALNFKEIVLEARTERGCRDRWADLKKRAKNYDTSNIDAALSRTQKKTKQLEDTSESEKKADDNSDMEDAEEVTADEAAVEVEDAGSI